MLVVGVFWGLWGLYLGGLFYFFGLLLYLGVCYLFVLVGVVVVCGWGGLGWCLLLMCHKVVFGGF